MMLDPVRTRDWLKSSHILVPDDWLQACVEWIQSENQGPQQLSQNDLNSMVYEQWLLADLHELETRCLPSDVATAPKYQLSGAYALQIDSILNVGQSFYSQSQKLKGTENANVHVTAEDAKPWEPKPSRMLLFKITDGSTSVHGMEYKPITCLSQATPPGTKVLVHGEVLCRHGYLMLGEHNLTMLGGEVDTLVEANTPVNTLKGAMDASIQYAGKNHRQQYAGSQLKHKKMQDTNQQSARSVNNQQQKRSQEPSFNSRVPRGQSRQGNQPQVKTDVDELMEDDPFLDEMDMNDLDLLSQPSTGNQSNMAARPQSNGRTGTKLSRSSAVPCNRNQPKNVKKSVELSSRPNSNAPRIEMPEDIDDMFADEFDAMDDDFDEEMLTSMPDEVFTAGNSKNIQQNCDKTNKLKNAKQTPVQTKRTPLISGPSDKRSSNERSSDKKLFPMFGQGSNKRDRTDLVHSDDDPSSDSRTDYTRNNNSATSTSNIARGLGRSEPTYTNVSKRPESVSQKRHMSTEPPAKHMKLEAGSLFSADSVGSVGVGICQKSSNNRPSAGAQEGPSTGSTGSKTGSTGEGHVKVEGSRNRLGLSVQSSKDTNSVTSNDLQRIKEEQHSAVRSQLDVQAEYPFTYLSKMMLQPRPTKPTYHTVKAYISTLTSKLSSENQQWKLSCKINDGTLAVDVDLSSKVLTEMIGFSPQEAQKMKSRVKIDPSVRQVLTEGIQKCQQKLIELMCLLELELSPLNARPVIVATRELTSHHIDMLHTRVIANWDKFNSAVSD